MKKIIWLLQSILYPYCMLFFLFCIFTGFLVDDIYPSVNIISVLICLGALFLIAVIGNIIFVIQNLAGKCSTINMPLINMLLKLIHIPAYILIFIFGLLCALTIFMIGFSLFFIIFDCLTIFLSGMIGILTVRVLYNHGKCTRQFAILLGILQFIFIADVISAIVIYNRAKS